MKYKSSILPSANVSAMVAALKSAGLSCDKTATTRVVKARHPVSGVVVDIFRAMKHSHNGSWLVRHADDLFA